MVKKRIRQSKTYQKIKRLYDTYERFIVPCFLVLGFILDVITFKVINLNTALTILGAYLILTAGAMMFITVYDQKDADKTTLVAKYLRIAASLVMQFTIGALLSATIIFYTFGSAFSVSWPIILFVFMLIIANERHKYLFKNTTIQFLLLFLLVFVYCSLIFPVLFNNISLFIFILSGFSALTIIIGYYHLLKKLLPNIAQNKQSIIVSISILFLVINASYALNIIPPVPLAIRDSGIYHHLVSQNNEYVVTQEVHSIVDKIIPGQTIHITPGDPVYVYTAIFAPNKFRSTVSHRWQFLNPKNSMWETKSELSFQLSGGRKQGFRGYSLKRNTQEGKWRVFTYLPNGQILGKTSFRIKYTSEKVKTEENIK